MILHRHIARECRWEQRETLKSWAHDLRYEGLFEYALLKSARGEAVGIARPMKSRSLESHADRCAGEIGSTHSSWTFSLELFDDLYPPAAVSCICVTQRL
ncbi:hypothetical protein AZE42_00648 [Rhizopogon vesiculosus]|uniref:Uncharacterized protein n=1 Tax=Rhizopogon vesiculosus TaxID=180088 RepID=A0A1J8QSX0_9AGAM|nr:hypothetical protein AZE42_00648 [Rhizopogon vesiculosus]